MPTFTPKEYQASALRSIEAYFRTCQRMGNADYAFQVEDQEIRKVYESSGALMPLFDDLTHSGGRIQRRGPLRLCGG